MHYNKILSVIIVLYLAIISINNLFAQVVIKEELKINPDQSEIGTNENTESYSYATGFPCEANIWGGDCQHFYQVVWSNSTYPLDPLQQPCNYQGNFCILDPFISGKYDIQIISGAGYCTIYECSRNYEDEKIDAGNSLIDVSSSDFIPEGGDFKLFDGMPMNSGYCKYEIHFEDTRSRNSYVTYTFQPHGSTDLVYFHTTIKKPVAFRVEAICPRQYLMHGEQMDIHLDPIREEGNCGDFMFSNGGGFPHYLKMSAEIVAGGEYGSLYCESTGASGDALSNLENDEPVWFRADGIEPVGISPVVVRLTASGYPSVDVEFYVIPGNGLFVDFEPPVVTPWGVSSIIFKRYVNGEFVNLPDNQLFNIRITEGSEYADLVSEANLLVAKELPSIIQEDLYLYSHDIIGDTARIKVYAETYVEDTGGGGTATSIKEKNESENPDKVEENRSTNEQIKISGYGEILIVKTGARLVVSFDKNPIAPGETAQILIEGINDEGEPFNIPSEQTFYLSLGDSVKYGELFSTSTGQTGEFIENAPKDFLFIAKDSIDVDSAYVDVYVMMQYEAGDGLGKISSTYKGNKTFSSDRLMKMLKEKKGTKQNLLLNKSTGKESSTTEDSSVNEIFYLYGMARLLITKDNNAKLEIITPVADSIFYISNVPEMPTKTFRAEFSGIAPITTAVWSCTVSYNYPPGDDTHTFSEEVNFNSDNSTVWDLDFNDNNPIIGGKATLQVTATFNNVTYVDSKDFHIRGRNPDRADIEAATDDNGQFTMVRTESNGLEQFHTENYAVPNEGLPLRSTADTGTGWGLCQIDQGSHEITTAILWDWTANLEAGLNYYNQQRNGAENRLENIGHLDTPPESFTRQSMIDFEGYSRYNGGPSARVWEWIPRQDGASGHWVRNVTAIRNGARSYNPDIDENVRHYEGNYNN